MKAKAISLWQPHASLIPLDSLGVETSNLPCWDELPFGCAIALVDLTNCIRMTPGFIGEQTESEKRS